MAYGLKPYINVKVGPDPEFQVTRLDIDVEEYSGGKLFYLVVGHDDNHGKVKNIYGSSALENVLSELMQYSALLARVIADAAIAKWKKENEIEE